MSQAGYTPIQLYYSTTAAATPSAGNLAAGELAVNITDGKLFYKDNGGVVRVLATAAGSAGDVVGPGSSTDNALVRFDGTTGKLVQNSAGVLSDAGALSGLTSVAATTFTGALTGNASTATTLQTSRTIWGQSFDGSANVTGALTGVTDLTASGSLTLNGGTANGVPYLNGSKVLTTGSALTFDGTNLNVGSTAIAAVSGGSVTAGVISARAPLAAHQTGAAILQYTASEGAIRVYGESGSAGQLVFNLGIGGSVDAEQMRLTSTGLGIGTSSPFYRLDVSGASGSTYARVADSTSANNLLLGVNASTVDIKGLNGFPMAFYTANAERMRLDTSGNLGLGVTPSAWVSGKAIELAGTGLRASLFQSNSGVLSLAQNYYFNGGADIYAANGFATRYYQLNGQHVWNTAPSGTAGNAITFTQAMTLDASGNLSVGTTSLPGRLNVYNTDNAASVQLYLENGGTSDVGIRIRRTGADVGFMGNGSYCVTGGGSTNFGIQAVNNLLFATGGSTERARIDSSGNLLVGLTSNTATFSSRLVLSYNSGTTQWGVGPWINNPTNFYISANGGAQGVYLNGATATSWTGWSDERIKDELQPIENAAAKVCTLRAVTGVFKEDETKTRKAFLIAQDVLAVLPEAVDTSNPDRFGLSYTDTIPLLVKAIQEQQAIITALTARVAALESN